MTTTTNLGIEHMIPGEISKETIFNEALDLIDKNLSQFVSVAVSVNATLSDSNAEYGVISFTGAPGAVRTIKLPKNKTYFIANGVTGGYSVIVCGTGFAPSTVEIPNGRFMIIYQKDDNETYAISYGANPTGAFLLNGAVPDVHMTNAVNIQSIASSLKFAASAAGVVPLVAKGFTAQTADIFQIQNVSNTELASFDASGDLDLNTTQKVLNMANASGAADGLPKGQADGLYAPIAGAYLTVGADGTLTGETNISSLGSTLKFVASGGGVTPFAVKAAGSPSVNIFEVQDSSNVAQWAINSSFEMDAKTHKIKNVVDPAAAQDAATKNYNDTTSYSQILNFSAESLTVSVGTTYYLWPNTVAGIAATTERWLAVTSAGKIAKLRVFCAVAPAGGTVTFTVRKKTAGGGTGAGSDQSLTCTMSIGATLATDLSNSFTVAAGDEISVKLIENASYSGSMARIGISMELTLA